MDRPTALLLTADLTFAEACRLHAPAAIKLVVCTMPDDAATQALDLRPQAFIADFRGVVDGGHFGARLLEYLQVELDEMAVVMLTDADCPEPLERRAACTPIVHLCKDVTAEDVAAVLLRQCPADDGTRDVVPEAVADAVLEGVTRRFETRSPRVKRMLEDLAIAASHDVTILLIGETGSGKTYLSNLIHEASARRDEPFIHVACGALPRELLESEMFGHAKGSFTSAHADKEGKFIAAGRGTILLDEIDVLGLEQQVKLLRVIETGEFEPVGSNRTLKSRARLVVASNLDLHPLVEQGRFRPDLYYRLNMLKFDIPPLRQRKMDILPLARAFIAKFAEKHGVRIGRIDDRLFEALVAYPWPGNVRELEHVIQRAVIYCRGEVLSERNLPQHILLGHVGPTNDPSVRLSSASAIDPTLGQQIALNEKEIIEQALFRNNHSRTQTARDLGISRVTLYNKMRKHAMMK